LTYALIIRWMSPSEPADKVPITRTGYRAYSAELAVLGLAGILAVLTLYTLIDQNLRFGVMAPQADIVINEAATLIAWGTAGLAWLRYRHMRDGSAAYEASAFVLFGLLAIVQLIDSLGLVGSQLGLTIDAPRQAPVYAWALIRLFAATLLVRAAWLRSHRQPIDHPARVVVVPLAAAVGASLVLYVLEQYLPAALGADALAELRDPALVTGALPGVGIIELGLLVAGVILCVVAAALYLRAARLGGGTAARYLAAGLVLAAFSQIHFALFPGAFSELVSTSDLLRVAFYICVVFGIQAEAGSTLRQLRAANVELAELRRSEVARASLAERTRLAREVHDGLAQDLWVAKLATERLGKAADMDEVREVHRELEGLIEASIAEARETVLALREAGKSGAALSDMLERYVARFGDQTGLETQLLIEPRDFGALAPEMSTELLRIAQEALNNVRRHADASRVTVELVRTRDGVRLTVRDDGVGFDVTERSSGYGLESMRERSAIAGGTLSVESGATSGTVVTVELATGAA
jgi:signal transduction histidine kinase